MCVSPKLQAVRGLLSGSATLDNLVRLTTRKTASRWVRVRRLAIGASGRAMANPGGYCALR